MEAAAARCQRREIQLFIQTLSARNVVHEEGKQNLRRRIFDLAHKHPNVHTWNPQEEEEPHSFMDPALYDGVHYRDSFYTEALLRLTNMLNIKSYDERDGLI